MLGDIGKSVESKRRAGNRILFSRDSECLKELIGLIGEQTHRALVLWALDCARAPLAAFEAGHPDEMRPGRALELCEAWARGDVKMPEAKRAILDAHAAAKDVGDRYYAALAHAIGQAGATVHVGTHAPGLVFYELTAIVLREGVEGCEAAVTEKIEYYRERLVCWRDRADEPGRRWAKFLLDGAKPAGEDA